MWRTAKLTLALSVPLAGFAALLAVLGVGLEKDPTVLPSVLIAQPLPAFSLPDLRSETDRVTERDLVGEVALVNVWGTWCPSCRDEQPLLMRLAADGVVIHGLNYKDERAAARRWLAAYGNPFREIVEDADGQLTLDLGVYGAPETYLLDDDGVIRYRHVGVLDERTWRDEFVPRIAALTKGTP